MKIFGLAELPISEESKASRRGKWRRISSSWSHERLDRFTGGEISPNTLCNFLDEYGDKTNNPEGVTKFMNKLAGLCFRK